VALHLKENQSALLSRTKSSKNKNTKCSENQWPLQAERMYKSKKSCISSFLNNYNRMKYLLDG